MKISKKSLKLMRKYARVRADKEKKDYNTLYNATRDTYKSLDEKGRADAEYHMTSFIADNKTA